MKQCKECGEHIPNHVKDRLCAACKKKRTLNETERDRHDFQPVDPDTGHHECQVCGFDRHHPWHQ